jgi:hypothetical protein
MDNVTVIDLYVDMYKFMLTVMTAHFAPKEAVEYTSKVEAFAAKTWTDHGCVE